MVVMEIYLYRFLACALEGSRELRRKNFSAVYTRLLFNDAVFLLLERTFYFQIKESREYRTA